MVARVAARFFSLWRLGAGWLGLACAGSGSAAGSFGVVDHFGDRAVVAAHGGPSAASLGGGEAELVDECCGAGVLWWLAGDDGAVGLMEHDLTAGVAGDVPVAFVHQSVMSSTQTDEVVGAGGAEVDPVFDVVAVDPGRHGAAGESAAAVAAVSYTHLTLPTNREV